MQAGGVTLHMDSNELISDLIKIGIPSLVAFAGTISSLLLAWWGNKQNILITNLQHSHTQQVERNNRTGELAKLCARDLSRLNDKFVSFGTIFYAKIDTLNCDDLWPEAEQKLITERFQEALLSLGNHATIKSYILLLGDERLAGLHDAYLKTVSKITTSYALFGYMEQEEFSNAMEQSSHLHVNLTKIISDIYLLK